MKRIKQLSIVLIVLISTIGFASAAFNMVITDPASTMMTPGDLGGISYIVGLTGIETSPHQISATVSVGTASDLEFYFTNGSTSSGWIASGVSYMWSDIGASQSITMNVRAIGSPTDPIGSTYDIYVVADDTARTASATTTGTTIPEFPTVALPIAAILGLAFIFQRRKGNE